MGLGLVMYLSCNLPVIPSKDIILWNTVKSFLVCFSHRATESPPLGMNIKQPLLPTSAVVSKLYTLSSEIFTNEFRERKKNNFVFDFTRSSGFSVEIQEEVFAKSSQGACSCCHCQKQSELLGLHSHSRKSRGAGKYSGQFSACWVKCLTNTWWPIQQLFVSKRHSILPAVYTVTQILALKRTQHTNALTLTHQSMSLWVDLLGAQRSF